MSLAAVLLILAAIAAAQAIAALISTDPNADLATMAAILAIAVGLVVLGLGATAVVAIDHPMG